MEAQGYGTTHKPSFKPKSNTEITTDKGIDKKDIKRGWVRIASLFVLLFLSLIAIIAGAEFGFIIGQLIYH